ncbi:MAG: T9SS type A sorting domain-containing protein, partial [Bacteroidia bacterium]|nr:T9SS type A sorting domain-containing protein [Bacteroidia bacterium]
HILINNSLAVGEKTPGQYVPVSQGFFVNAFTGGTITFKNSQRTFKKEEIGSSVFMKGTIESSNRTTNSDNSLKEDNRQKIRLMFDSSLGYHRQLLVGVDENCTSGFDIGYDGLLIEDIPEDMYWVIDNENYIIQGVPDFNNDRVLPLEVKTNADGNIVIRIDYLENISDDLDIYLHDAELGTFHDLRDSDFSIFLNSGIHSNRFEIVFETLGDGALNLEEENIESIGLHYSNSNESIVLVNPNYLKISEVELFDILGKLILKETNIPISNIIEIEASGLSTGTYILKAETEFGTTTKKVIIN